MKKTTEKENSTPEQQGEVSQFKNGENHNSGMMKKATQELGKSQSIKTEKNDTDKNETDSIPSYLINQTDKVVQMGWM